MDSKKCSKCGEVKAASEYHKASKRKDGLQAYCKPCLASYRSVRNQRAEVKESERLRQERWRRDNPEADRKKAVKWKSKNKDKLNALIAKRRTAKIQRTASWANEQLIAAYYTEAKRLEELTGIQFHVDHIIPLQGELVSGLHVESNLQLLPAHENMGKSNSFDPAVFVV